jgi:hypothetical protein
MNVRTYNTAETFHVKPSHLLQSSIYNKKYINHSIDRSIYRSTHISIQQRSNQTNVIETLF